MKRYEKTLKALANRRRLAILRYLRREESANVSEIAAIISLSFRSTSKHLGVLANAEILEKEQHGLEMFYKLAPNLDPITKHIVKLL